MRVREILWTTAGARRWTWAEIWLYNKGKVVWPVGSVFSPTDDPVVERRRPTTRPTWWPSWVLWPGTGWFTATPEGDIPTYIGGAVVSINEEIAQTQVLPLPVFSVPNIEADEIRGHVAWGAGVSEVFLALRDHTEIAVKLPYTGISPWFPGPQAIQLPDGSYARAPGPHNFAAALPEAPQNLAWVGLAVLVVILYLSTKR